ncbi:MAG: hypothetical protein FWG55_04790 [Candidatus Bathyarchaeota archaeon]|nr:hypothetical protein [Candidatus Termiticorpusculum sp.]
MEFEIKIHEKQHLAYIPKVLYKILGTNVKAVPNRAAILLFSEKTTMDEALTSLDIIKADLLHAKTLQQIDYSESVSCRRVPRVADKNLPIEETCHNV